MMVFTSRMFLWLLVIFLTSQNQVINTQHIINAEQLAVTPKAPIAKPSCKGIVDVGFILDSSGSLKNDYAKEKDFLKTLASTFGVSENGSRAGVVTFSYYSEHSIKLNDHYELKSFNDAVDNIKLMGHTTRIDKALRLTQQQMFTIANGARPNVSKLLVLLTDGSQTPGKDAEDPASIANELRQAGISIIVVGIGKGVNKTELADIAGSDRNVFSASSFDDLLGSAFIKEIKNESCKAAEQLAVTPKAPIAKPSCKSIVDVGFILDSSGSLENDYEREKTFLKTLASTFGVSKNGSRAGVITFSYYSEHSIKLNDHYNLTSFNEAVDNIKLMKSTTRIDRALRLTQQQMFTIANGARPNVSKLLVLLTDGSQTPGKDAEDPASIANELRQAGISIIVVGIGKGVNKTELADIAGSDRNVFSASSFDDLLGSAFIKEIKNESCKAAEQLAVTPKAPIAKPSCKSIVDVGFILDSSGSLENDYEREKTFLKTLASTFGVSKNGSRAGVITFSYYSEHSIKLNDHYNLTSFNEAVDNIKLMKSTTRIDRALRLTQQQMFTIANGARPNVSKLLVLLTDGSQTPGKDAEDPASIANELRQAGISIIVVGIGKGVNKTELADIAGSDRNVFSASSFDDLLGSAFIKEIKNESCKAAEQLAVTPKAPIAKQSCKGIVDVGFILDSSGSLKNDYAKEKDFLKTLASTFGVSKNGSRAGVVTFSYYSEHSIKLNDHYKLKSFNDAVDNIKLMGHTTRIDKALRLTQQQMFTIANGARPNVSKLLVLLTDGSQTPGKDAEDPASIANELRQAGISIIVVGIGKGVNKTELADIAGSDRNVFSASSFDDLLGSAFIKEIKNESCKAAEQLAVTPKAPIAKQSCKGIVDVGFILDSSGSLKNDYAKEKDFLKTLASTFGVSENGSRAGVVTFSYYSEHSIKLNDHYELKSFNDAVDNIKLMGHTTRIDKALRLTQQQMFTIANGARPNVSKLLVLLTDGSQTPGKDAEDPASIANELRQAGISIIVVGIGKGVNKTELADIAGSDRNVFSASSFDDLLGSAFIKEIKNESCKAAEQLAVTPKAPIAKPSCKSIVDVGFILDSSGSLENDYEREKTFLKTLASTFGVSKNGSRAGVITFSYYSEHSIKLNDHYNLTSFNEAVDNIKLMKSTTRIDRALRLTQQQMFTIANGARPNVSKLLVLLTDGSQTPGKDAEDPASIANELRQAGISIIVVGIGKGVNKTELADIAGSDRNVFSASSFDDLLGSAFIKEIKNESCKAAEQLAVTPKAPIAKPSCKSIVDVGFILDSSGSLENDYEREKTFLKTLASTFGVSKNGSRAGVITFSYYSEHSIKLNDHYNLTSFNEAVDNIKLMKSTTRIDRALRLTQQQMFTIANGARPNVSKLLVLLTDGSQTPGKDAEDPASIANELRQAGISIIVVGIGKGVNKTELADIAGSDRNVFSASSFDDLLGSAFIKEIKNESCKAAEQLAVTPKAPIAKQSCKGIVDVGFILDSSGSLKNDYAKEKDFLKTLASTFGVSENGSRAGVVTFSYYSEHSIKLNDHYELKSFNDAVDNIKLMGHTTRIDKALRLTQQQMFTIANGARPNVSKLLVLLTDGSQTPGKDAEDPASIANELRQAGISIIVVGIGKGVNKTELADIAGSDRNVFSASSFDDLLGSAFIKEIKNESCKAAEQLAVTPKAPIAKPSCKSIVDVGFILDSSGSLENDYEREKTFLKTLASTFGVSKNGSRAGVITFSYYSEHSIKLNDHYNLTSFNEAVDNIKLMKSTTRIDRALRLTQQQMFTIANGARPNVSKLLVLLTDGSQTPGKDAEDPASIANELRQAGISIIVVGIGKGVNKTELADIAGSDRNVFSASSFDDLLGSAFIKEIKNESCKAAEQLAVTPNAPIAKPSCKSIVDVGFILDSSGSLENDYEREKTFLKTLASTFGVSKNGSRAGVITFSYYSEHSIKLNDHYNLTSFNEAVDNIKLMKSTTRIDRALRLTQQQMFTIANGARPNVSKLLVLLTDGSQTPGKDAEDPASIANELRQAGISIIVVGIGKGVNKTELADIAGSDRNVFSASSFDDLLGSAFIKEIKNESCKAAEQLAVTPKAPIAKQSCKGIVDVGFILDSSGSLKNDYAKEKDFLKTLASTFGVSENGSRAGVVTFSYYSEHSIKLNDHYELKSFNDAVDNIKLMGHTTRIDKALRLTQQQMFTIANGARPNVSKLLVLLTDGSQTPGKDAEDPASIANELRQAGISIIVVGIGKGVNKTELADIAGSDRNVFSASSFDDLLGSAFIKEIKNESCKAAEQLAVTPKAPIAKPSCKSIVDVGFILDSSGSLENDYEREKTFLKTLASTFGVSKNGSRAGVITFSYYSEHSIKLNDHYNLTSFNEAVDNIKLMKSTTRIDRALRLTQQQMFTIANGARPNVSKLLVLLTDGSQTPGKDAEDPASIANELRQAGISIIVVGIGKGVNKTELADIAGSDRNVFSASSFDDLLGSAFIKEIKNESCKAAEQLAVTPKAPIAKPSCKSIVDVGFILDSSGSLENDYEREKTFLKTLASTFGVSKNGSRAGVITFSYYSEHSIKLNDHYNLTSFNEAVDNIKLMKSTTRIDRALRLTQQQMFTIANGARPNVSKLLVLLTDGSQTPGKDAEDPASIANELRQAGISIIVVGIGKGVNKTELADIAGSDRNVFSASSFDDLLGSAFIKEIKNESCKAAEQLAVTPKAPIAKQSCKGIVDVGFILDSSGSLKNDYAKEKDFLKTLASTFGVSENGSRAGVVTFSYYSEHSIKLNDHYELKSFNDAVDNIKLMGHTTRIDKALRLTQQQMFTIANGARPNVSKLLVLLTDGSQTPGKDAEDPASIANELRQAGISIIVVGIGKGVNKTELADIAGSDRNVFSASSFDDLLGSAFIKEIKNESCKAAEQLAVTPKAPIAKPSCKSIVDVGFILDSSGSLENDYEREKTFLKTLASTFGVSKNGSRAGVITFSYYSEHSIKLNDHYNLTSFNEAVDNIKLMKSTTRIDRALRLTQQQMFTIANGARPNVSKLLVLLTDGSQTPGKDAEDPASIANELRQAGISIIVVGIGKGVNKTELADIAGSDRNVFSASSFDDLLGSAFIKEIKNESCKAAEQLAVTPNAPIAKPSCKSIVDVGFILDSSGSLENDYEREKTFLKTLASTFGVSKNGSRAGVITFSYYSEHSIKLNDHYNLTSFNEAVDNIKLMKSTTRIDRALRLTQQQMFTIANGARPNVSKLLVLLTDGSQTPGKDAEDPASIANELRQAGISIIVVGIGKGVNKTELADIAGSDRNVFSASSFDDLLGSAFIKEIKNESCKAAEQLAVTPKAPIAKQSCKGIVDVGFILDSSGSLKNDYAKEKDFLKTLASTFGVSENGSRAGVVTFSYYSEHSIKLNDHYELKSFNDAVDNIKLMGHTTRIDKALRLTQQQMFTIANGARPNVSKLLVLLTDGSQTPGKDAEDPASIANELRQAGISIIVVGIGKGVNKTELADIAGSDRNVFSASSFDDLLGSAFIKEIKNESCKAAEQLAVTPKAPIEKPSCKSIVDVGFILDSSGSLKNDYAKEKDFLKTLASTFGVSENGSRAGVVTFSYYSEHSIKLNDHYELKSFNDAVDNIKLMGHTTRIDKALRLTQQQMFAIANGARPNVSKLLVLLTDGSQTPGKDAEDPASIANELRQAGISIIVVGIGKGVNKTELADIAGSDRNVFSASSFDDLLGSAFIKEIKNESCKADLSNTRVKSLISSGPASDPVSTIDIISKVLKDGTCPVEKDMKVITGWLRSGIQADWIVRFYNTSNILPGLLQYHESLTYIMNNLEPVLKKNDTGLQNTDVKTGCRSKLVESVLSNIFRDKSENEDIFSLTRKNNGGHFIDLLWSSGIANTVVQLDEDKTLFVPSNKALTQLPTSIREKLKDVCYLRQVLLFHIVRGKHMVSNMTNNKDITSFENSKLIFYNADTKSFSGVVAVDTDIEAKNGVLHIVDGVMLPPEYSIVEIMKKYTKFSLFYKALLDPVLAAELKTSSHLTVFAIDDETIQNTNNNVHFNSDGLRQFLRKYITNEVLYSITFSYKNELFVKSIAGTYLSISRTHSNFIINGKLTIKQLDIHATNGVVHIVDRLTR